MYTPAGESILSTNSIVQVPGFQEECHFGDAQSRATYEAEQAILRRQEEEKKLLEFKEKTAKNAKLFASKQKTKQLSAAEQRKKDAAERRKKMQEFNKSVRGMVKSKPTMKTSSVATKTQQNSKLISSASVPLARVVEKSEPRSTPIRSNIVVEEETQVMKSSKGSGPMRESELFSHKKPKVFVDEGELQKVGMDSSTIDPQVLPQLEQFFYLQRFRAQKSLHDIEEAPVLQTVNIDTAEETKEPEPQTLQAEPTMLNYRQIRDQKKTKTGKTQFQSEKEKERYFQALQALIKQKVEKKNEIPPDLCSCRALEMNIGAGAPIYPCANNCPFYNNPKEYKKALTDVIHSLNSK